MLFMASHDRCERGATQPRVSAVPGKYAAHWTTCPPEALILRGRTPGSGLRDRPIRMRKKMEPEDIDALLDQANRSLEAGRPADSLRYLDQVESHLLDSDVRIECASLRAHALCEMGQTDEALQTLEPLLEEFPESARLFGALGIVLSTGNDLEQAREALETAIALDPDDATLIANLALVYEKLRDYTTAIRLYNRALDLGADLDWALQRKAAALVEVGDPDAAKVTLKRYLSLVPDDAGQWIAVAILHSDDEEYVDSFACYAKAAEIDPDSPVLHLNWGVSAVRAGQLPLAREHLAELLRVDPDSTRPVLLEAFILEEQGDLRTAQRRYAAAVAGVRSESYSELVYTYEMAMDFYVRRKLRARCERLLRRAYRANACTVELCEAYRELTGPQLEHAYWFSVVIEADYRPGLYEVMEAGGDRLAKFTRYQRGFQVVARDRDEATTLVLAFAQRLGETGVLVCEFTGEEPLDHGYAGIYEVERESLVLEPM
jgi:tetratricopeptide (TPR) repeat protein